MNSLIPVLWVLPHIFSVSTYDGYTTCTKPFRGGKSRLDVPCDFSAQTWCTIPGSYYPWRAVRRFVYENHGLMRRMYGEERHISVLRSEIESNDVEYHSDKWSQQANMKRYKLKTEELAKSANSISGSENIKSSIVPVRTVASSTTTTYSTTTTSTTRSTTTSVPNVTTATSTTQRLTSAASSSGNKSTLYETTTSTQLLDVTAYDTTAPPTTIESDYSTTPTEEINIDVTTLDYETLPTTDNAQALPQIFQDTLEKSSSTTEKSNLFYKGKGVNACPVKEEVVAPFWANSTRGEVLALLNLYPFEQYVHWERCTFENKQMFCREGCRCEQQYRLHRLLAYDPTNDCRGIFSDWFKFPSCCVCRCYDLPNEFRLTSRSPRKDKFPQQPMT